MPASRSHLTACLLAALLAGVIGCAPRPAPAQAAWPTPIALGPESIYAEFDEGDLVTAGRMLDDVWPARPPLAPCTWTGR